MEHRFIEELSLNHWQPLSTLLFDGWVLRFADGYTKRANSINPIFPSTCELHDKINHCESLYSAHRLPTIFKMTPFASPPHLDNILEKMGYSLLDTTSVQVLDLERIKEPKRLSVHVDENINAAWLEHFRRLAGIQEKDYHVMERMLSHIRTKKGFILLYDEEQVVACGLGVIEREYIGLYDIVTDVKYRNRGFGEQLLLNLLQWGKANGAKHSYLAVVSTNEPALKLYAKIGYSEIYTYWYRVKGGIS